eukprot:6941392-Pyramimonas_sp.AAC.1
MGPPSTIPARQQLRRRRRLVVHDMLEHVRNVDEAAEHAEDIPTVLLEESASQRQQEESVVGA